ncbi:GMC family oxidoreductase [Caulobacter sp. SLTY]|uniref:GMC oxidoreductase n=1 Tax=Caulobacter sp. SLTY TaxID=2683262 RepID=UPI001412A6DA|nr:GMC family oxidoreductase [Caulobacter sp. SLTY]NBB17382.1 GMC family oxidoreductase [Caulobacter sp. SLTY]
MALIDAQALPDASRIEADLIIVGGGLAGITIARQFLGTSVRIAVLEAGGRDIDMDAQEFYVGSATVRAPGNPDRELNNYPVQSRTRVLGGSGMVWGGKCVPLDPSDFAERPWIPHSGWPITRQDLQPYYDRACDLLEIPHFPPNAPPAGPAIDVGPDFFSAPRVFTRYSGGTDEDAFDRFRTEFASAPNVDVYLHANVTRIGLNAAGDRVETLDIACLNGRRHSTAAKSYILATGGIENVRLLLASNDRAPAGVGNGHDLVGRFFQAHVVYAVDGNAETEGSAIQLSPGQPTALYINLKRGGPQSVFAATLEGQKRLNSGNFTCTLYANAGPPAPGGVAEETAAIGALAATLDGKAGQGRGPLVGCFLMAEHFPNPDSRITLRPEKDALGLPHIHMDWTYSAADLDGLEHAVDGLADALGARGKGRLCWPGERSALVAIGNASRHHMGATRMHPDPKRGVVDADSKVHGLANLHIAGSSVFPTSGIANPTLTLLALAIRLADHLKPQLGATR